MYEALPVHTEGRDVFLSSDDPLGGAPSFVTVLSSEFTVTLPNAGEESIGGRVNPTLTPRGLIVVVNRHARRPVVWTDPLCNADTHALAKTYANVVRLDLDDSSS